MPTIEEIFKIQKELKFSSVKELYEDPRFEQIIADVEQSKKDFQSDNRCFSVAMLNLTMIAEDNKFKNFK